MRVGLTMRVISAPNYSEMRDGISHDWFKWAAKQEIIPIPIPNHLVRPHEFFDATGITALILTGGNDLIQSPQRPDDVSPIRNETETALLQIATEKHIPVLGTCRGLHLINQFFGGELTEDIGPNGSLENRHVGCTHEVRLTSTFQNIAQAETIVTNSFHNQGILSDQLADALEPLAVSVEDNIIEGAFHPHLPILGVQWHPERDNPASQFDDHLISRFFENGCFWSLGS
jgi:N5-(cytidine 5'-diphosphoramidyl)-L-glutamine hydrolase